MNNYKDSKIIFRVIADVHGLHEQYHQRIKKAQYSIQLGDFGFSYKTLENVDPNRHKILLGNHDCYDAIPPHSLGDFGMASLGGIDFFFIRGAYSVDKKYRVPGKSWWEAEELTWLQGEECLKLYKETKPDLVLSHDCPFVCYEAGVLTNPGKYQCNSMTTQILQACWESHKPKQHIFAHHHNNWQREIEGTLFTCRDELCFVDLDEKGNIVRYGK